MKISSNDLNAFYGTGYFSVNFLARFASMYTHLQTSLGAKLIIIIISAERSIFFKDEQNQIKHLYFLIIQLI